MNEWTKRAPHTVTQVVSSPTLIARFMGSTWGSSGADRTQVGPVLGCWPHELCYLGTWRHYYIIIELPVLGRTMTHFSHIVNSIPADGLAMQLCKHPGHRQPQCCISFPIPVSAPKRYIMWWFFTISVTTNTFHASQFPHINRCYGLSWVFTQIQYLSYASYIMILDMKINPHLLCDKS